MNDSITLMQHHSEDMATKLAQSLMKVDLRNAVPCSTLRGYSSLRADGNCFPIDGLTPFEPTLYILRITIIQKFEDGLRLCLCHCTVLH